MTKQARLWTGATLVFILAANYGIFCLPLIRKAQSLNDKATVVLMNKIKNGHSLRTTSEEEYLLDIFRRERESVVRKLVIYNAISFTILIIIGSWTLFGVYNENRKNKEMIR